jgi:hypothetical protein
LVPIRTHQITANDIASRLQRVFKDPMDQSHVRSTKRVLRQKRRELTIDPELLPNFSTKELNTVLLAVKSGKAAGFDGVYSEFIINSRRTKEWIVALFNDILTFGKIPKLFKRVKVITILKLGNVSFGQFPLLTTQYGFQDI